MGYLSIEKIVIQNCAQNELNQNINVIELYVDATCKVVKCLLG